MIEMKTFIVITVLAVVVPIAECSYNCSGLINYSTPKLVGQDISLGNVTFCIYEPTAIERLVFVLTGKARNYADYLAAAIPLANATNSLLVVPDFNERTFSVEDYKRGAVAGAGSDQDVLQKSIGSILTDIYQMFSQQMGVTEYAILGHSLGAQLAVSLAAFYYPALIRAGNGNMPTSIIAANAGVQFIPVLPAINYTNTPFPMNSLPMPKKGSINSSTFPSGSWGSLVNCLKAKYNIIPSPHTECNRSFARDEVPSSTGKCVSVIPPVVTTIEDNGGLPASTNIRSYPSKVVFPDSYNGFYVDNTKEYLGMPLYLVQGRADINPCGGGAILNNSTHARDQGPSRLLRGANSYFTNKLLAEKKYKIEFKWNFNITEDIVGHNARCMFESPEVVYALARKSVSRALGSTAGCYGVDA